MFKKVSKNSIGRLGFLVRSHHTLTCIHVIDIDIAIDTLFKVEILLAIRLVYRYPTTNINLKIKIKIILIDRCE